MPPDRAADRAHARAACALLLPEFLARTGNLVACFDLVGTRSQPRPVMPHRFIEQRFIDLCAEHGVGQFNLADLLIIQIAYIHRGHLYLFALRTTTYPPFGPGTAPFTTSTLSSASTSTIS